MHHARWMRNVTTFVYYFRSVLVNSGERSAAPTGGKRLFLKDNRPEKTSVYEDVKKIFEIKETTINSS